MPEEKPLDVPSDVPHTIDEFGVIRAYSGGKELMRRTPKMGAGGIPYVTFFQKGRAYRKPVHFLFAKAFLPNPHDHTAVRFKDGNPENMNPSNLEWHSPKQLTEFERGEILRRIAEGHKGADIAKDFRISSSMISKMKKGER